MTTDVSFREAMEAAYALEEPAILLGAPLEGTEALTGVRVRVALAMLNRHGLVAGATGTGKTKTLQLIAGQLSLAGVPTFIADVKGDLTGLAVPGDAADPKIAERAAQVGIEYVPSGHPVELLSLSGALGAQVRVDPQLQRCGHAPPPDPQPERGRRLEVDRFDREPAAPQAPQIPLQSRRRLPGGRGDLAGAAARVECWVERDPDPDPPGGPGRRVDEGQR